MLQVRLAYARLKVEHGWQRQTLTEVENLYFRHFRTQALTRTAQAQGRRHLCGRVARATLVRLRRCW